MKRRLLLILPLLFSLGACESLQPMMDKAGSGFDKIFGEPEGSKPAGSKAGAAPALSYDQAAVDCNQQQLSRPAGSTDFAFCMRSKGWTPP